MCDDVPDDVRAEQEDAELMASMGWAPDGHTYMLFEEDDPESIDTLDISDSAAEALTALRFFEGRGYMYVFEHRPCPERGEYTLQLVNPKRISAEELQERIDNARG